MRLFLKLTVVALALGAMALGLLALRQQRYEASSELSKAHWRILEQERALWRMRAEIARNSRPQDIRQAAERLKIDLEPIPNRVVPVASTATERDANRPAAGG
ncbi:MAG: hypothetical protein JNK53_04155 [Phycisphaerae bacterium]|nr:hypothetical protein [Phycisphaerae bacterium]